MPPLHRREHLTAALDRSPAWELGDELENPLQALREAGRARSLLGATFFRLNM
jgi:hypothetical protein